MAKRGNNEGSVYKRGDGRWVGAITLAKDGRRREYYGRTRAAVADKLGAAIRDHGLGLLPTGKRQTLGQFLAGWLDGNVRGTVAPSTEASYRLHVSHMQAAPLGDMDLEKLTPGHVEQYLRSLDGQLATGTIHNHRATLRRALNVAMRHGLVHRNVAALATPPRVKRAPSRFLTPDEAQRVLAAVQGDRLEALYRVALALGLRQGEALGLTWDDLDVEHRRLHVRHQLQRIGGESRLLPLKTKESQRTLSLPLVAVAALEDHRRRQLAESVVQRFVFCRPDGKPLIGTSVTHAFQNLMQRAGLGHLRFHDLRHSCASFLLAQGVPARVVMEVLGHTTIATTMNVYSHVMPSLLEESAAAMDRALGPR